MAISGKSVRRLVSRICLGSNGRKAILEKYNWENEEKKLLHLYAQLLNPVSMLKSKIDSVVA